MSDAPAEGAPAPPPPPPPPPPPEGAAQEGAAPEGGAPAGTGPPVLTIDPPIITVPAAGGQSVHQLNNSGGTRLAFKVKSTNNVDYRLRPVFGFVEPGVPATMEIIRSAGEPQEDKFVVQFKEAPADCTDARSLFKEGNLLGEVVLPANAQ